MSLQTLTHSMPNQYMNNVTPYPSFNTSQPYFQPSTVSLASFVSDLEQEIIQKVLKEVQMDHNNPNNLLMVTMCKIIDEINDNINNNITNMRKEFKEGFNMILEQQQHQQNAYNSKMDIQFKQMNENNIKNMKNLNHKVNNFTRIQSKATKCADKSKETTISNGIKQINNNRQQLNKITTELNNIKDIQQKQLDMNQNIIDCQMINNQKIQKNINKISNNLMNKNKLNKQFNDTNKKITKLNNKLTEFIDNGIQLEYKPSSKNIENNQNLTDYKNKSLINELNKINKKLTNYNNFIHKNMCKENKINVEKKLDAINLNITKIQNDIDESILFTHASNKINQSSYIKEFENSKCIINEQKLKYNELNIKYNKLKNINDNNYTEYDKLQQENDNMFLELEDLSTENKNILKCYNETKMSYGNLAIEYENLCDSIKTFDIIISNNKSLKTFKLNKEVALQSELIKTLLECDPNRQDVYVFDASSFAMQSIIKFMNFHYQNQGQDQILKKFDDVFIKTNSRNRNIKNEMISIGMFMGIDELIDLLQVIK